jgi:hypothetical protein
MQIGLPGILLILFIVLKILNVITWAWIWVLSPLWIPLVIWAVVLLIFGIIAFLVNR